VLERAGGHSNKPEYCILRLVFRQKTIDQIYQMARADRSIVIGEQLHRRIQQLRGLNSHEVSIFLFEKLNSRMGKRFQ
jgi:hypothetical protein